MNNISVYGYVLLAFSILVGSLMPIAFSLGSAISFTTLLLYVSIVGTITSFLMMIAKGTTSHLKAFLRDKTYIFAIVSLAILEYAIEPLGLSYATHYVTADLAAVVFRAWPILLVLIAPFVIKEKITKWDIAGVVIGFSALAVTMIGGTIFSIPGSDLPYVAILLIVAFGDALANAISKRYNYELMSSLFGYNLIALAIFAPLAILTNTWQLTVTTPSVIFSIVFIGAVFYAIFGYTFYESLRLIKTSFFSTAYMVVPFITMLISAAFLNVPVQPSYVLIGLGVVGGGLIQKLAPKNKGNFVMSKSRKKNMPLYDITAAFINTKNQEIYNTMKGGGRVLAFYSTEKNVPEAQIRSMSTERCIIFTDKHEGFASFDELEFIREITGAAKEQILIMGSGDPDKVTDRLTEINNLLVQSPV